MRPLNLEKGEACIWGKAGGEEIETSPQAIIDAIEISGFDAAVKEAIGHNKGEEDKSRRSFKMPGYTEKG